MGARGFRIFPQEEHAPLELAPQPPMTEAVLRAIVARHGLSVTHFTRLPDTGICNVHWQPDRSLAERPLGILLEALRFCKDAPCGAWKEWLW